MPQHPDDEPCRGVDYDDEPSEPPHIPFYLCDTCQDDGTVPVHHPSTDAVLYYDPCPWLDNPLMHPPSTPVPVQIITMPGRVPGHDAGCDGTCNYGYPNGCPPF